MDRVKWPPVSPSTLQSLRLRLLLSSNQRAGALAQLSQMAEKGISINDNRLVHLALRAFTHERAKVDAAGMLALVGALRKAGGRLDVVQYSLAMTHIGREKTGGAAVKEARALMGMMAEDGIPSNDVTFTTLIHILGQAGQLEAARDVLEEMRALGVQPSTITICALLNVHWKAGKGAEAVKIFDSLAARGLPRDARVYATVMQTLLSLGRAAEVSDYLDRMTADGIKPDGHVFIIMAKTYFAQRDWRAALRLLKVRGLGLGGGCGVLQQLRADHSTALPADRSERRRRTSNWRVASSRCYWTGSARRATWSRPGRSSAP